MKITRSKLREIIKETINEAENPCWEGYTQVGMKMKDGKQVPNCVPVSEANVIRALKEGDTEYQKYFRKELEKTGKSSPADMTDAEKKAFFTQVDKGWPNKNESVNNEAAKKVVSENTHVVVSMGKSGYGTLMSKPASQKEAEKFKKLTTPVRGEELKVITVIDARQLKNKLVGRELLESETIREAKQITVTKISDIPNLQNLVNQGKVSYRGLGMGKLSDDFWKLAGENGTLIKVLGKEYYITNSDFNALGGIKKIRFDAPNRR